MKLFSEARVLQKRWLRWSVAGFVIAGSLGVLAMALLRDADGHSVSFERWYGNWRAALIAAFVFVGFTLGFARPRRRPEWRNAGLATAFFISLFGEMFGIPLTIYLVAPLLGLAPADFGLQESHLWAFLLDRLGVLPLRHGVYAVMALSLGLIAIGASLVVTGWATVYRGRDRLVTEGIYRYLRHPQYLGLILIVVAFNIQWPTLPTLLMAPILIVMYVRLARREDAALAAAFGEAFREYRARTPAWIPRPARTRDSHADGLPAHGEGSSQR